ncbi:MAG: hypothetical protein EAZ53_16630 [Bacteroidetes bacterium]|nr:MAG: hypothetical protein EAZ53_16630 [Bacteroidota bacterium]
MQSKVQNVFIFFVLIALLLSTANLNAFSHKKTTEKKVENTTQKADFILKSVSVEATVNVLVSEVSFFILPVFKFDYTHIIYKSVSVVEPLFENSFLKILFSRIIPTKAP